MAGRAESGDGVLLKMKFFVYPGLSTHSSRVLCPAFNVPDIYFALHVILPFVRSYGEISTVTLSPGNILIKCILSLPVHYNIYIIYIHFIKFKGDGFMYLEKEKLIESFNRLDDMIRGYSLLNGMSFPILNYIWIRSSRSSLNT